MASTFVIRPGETDYDCQDRVQGNLNLPLNEMGEAQVEEMIGSVRHLDLEVIYASPSEPALSTATRLAEALDVPLKVTDQLKSMDLGLWQGLKVSEIRHKQPRVFKQWEDSPEVVRPPEGETCEEARERVVKALRKPMKRGKRFAVVASEPLATLIASVLRGEESHLPGPHCGRTSRFHVEHVEECISPRCL